MTLFLFGRVVLGVFTQVAVRPGHFNFVANFNAVHGLELFELFFDALEALRRHWKAVSHGSSKKGAESTPDGRPGSTLTYRHSSLRRSEVAAFAVSFQAVISVKELAGIARGMHVGAFTHQMGPFVVVQRPPDILVQQKAMALGAKRTMALSRDDNDDVSLLFEFDDLMVATLPRLSDVGGTLTVGRLPDCDVVVDDPSVSKHHARIDWDDRTHYARLEDLGSSNGTSVNGDELKRPVHLRDGDMIAFGDARFCFLMTETLFKRLTTGRFREGT